MCLGVPGRVVAVSGSQAVVDFWGVKRQVCLDLVDQPVGPGDYILNHVGYAIRRIPDEDIAGTLALYEQLLTQAETDRSDLMAADVAGELAATEGQPGQVGPVEQVGRVGDPADDAAAPITPTSFTDPASPSGPKGERES